VRRPFPFVLRYLRRRTRQYVFEQDIEVVEGGRVRTTRGPIRDVKKAFANAATAAGLWGRILARPVTTSGGAHRIAIDGGEIRFVAEADGRGPGVSATTSGRPTASACWPPPRSAASATPATRSRSAAAASARM
jgi:hypothetical protein